MAIRALIVRFLIGFLRSDFELFKYFAFRLDPEEMYGKRGDKGHQGKNIENGLPEPELKLRQAWPYSSFAALEFDQI